MKRIFICSVIVLLLNGCSKDPSSGCDALRTGIANNDHPFVKQEINKLCSDLYPVVTPADQGGHAENLNKLISRIKKCGIDAGILCYACIQTNPVLSEIYVSFTVNGNTIRRTFDIFTSEKDRLSFKSMHD